MCKETKKLANNQICGFIFDTLRMKNANFYKKA